MNSRSSFCSSILVVIAIIFFLSANFSGDSVYAWGKKKAKAKKDLALSPKKSLERAQKHLAKAYTLRQKGKVELAIDELGKAIMGDPSLVEAYLELGSLYTSVEAHAKSADMLEAGLSMADDQGIAPEIIGHSYCLLAQNHIALGVPDKASCDIIKAFTFLPQDPEPQKTLGKIYLSQGRIDTALAAFQKAAELEPDNAETWLMLGRLALENKRLSEANKAYHGLKLTDSKKGEEFMQEMKHAHVKPVKLADKAESHASSSVEDDPYALDSKPVDSPLPASDTTTPLNE